MKTIVQISLDLTSIPEAIETARMALRAGVDWLEAGTPLIIAGAFVVWPKTFEPMERRFAKMCPTAHRKGIAQVRRFINDLNRRFPE